MNALHYAAYFDVPELISVILKNAKPKGRNCYFCFTWSSVSYCSVNLKMACFQAWGLFIVVYK